MKLTGDHVYYRARPQQTSWASSRRTQGRRDASEGSVAARTDADTLIVRGPVDGDRPHRIADRRRLLVRAALPDPEQSPRNDSRR